MCFPSWLLIIWVLVYGALKTIAGLSHLNLLVSINNSYLLTDSVGQEFEHGKVEDSSLLRDDWGLSWGDLTGWRWLEHLGAGGWLASTLISLFACLMLGWRTSCRPAHLHMASPCGMGFLTAWQLGSQKVYIQSKQSKSKSFKTISGSWMASSDPALVVTQHHFCLVVLLVTNES